MPANARPSSDTGAWTPLLLAEDVPADTPVPVLVDGRELVVWRGADGAARVWVDRCPHRGMRLSFGFVRDGSLTCLYHGWRFAGDGACKAIPAHPDLDPPASLHAETLHAAEITGLVWLIGTGDGPAEQAATPVRSLALPVNAPTARARLGLDAAPLSSLSVPGQPPLLAAITPRGEGACILHLLIAGEADLEARTAVALWSAAFARDIAHALSETAHAA
ncbi:MAG: Rieske 2Fe-2S domain-containing protein [Pseudomonadota bacterium]